MHGSQQRLEKRPRGAVGGRGRVSREPQGVFPEEVASLCELEVISTVEGSARGAKTRSLSVQEGLVNVKESGRCRGLPGREPSRRVRPAGALRGPGRGAATRPYRFSAREGQGQGCA